MCKVYSISTRGLRRNEPPTAPRPYKRSTRAHIARQFQAEEFRISASNSYLPRRNELVKWEKCLVLADLAAVLWTSSGKAYRGRPMIFGYGSWEAQFRRVFERVMQSLSNRADEKPQKWDRLRLDMIVEWSRETPAPGASRTVLCGDVLAILPQFMETTDIKAFRLVSRKFADFGARWLVRDVCVDFRRSSFDKLEAISRHPIMSGHVRSISYRRPVVWRRGRNYEIWRNGVERTSCSKEESTEEQKEVASILEEEEAIDGIGSVPKQIKQSVQRLSKLQRIMMVTGSPDRIKEAREQGKLIGFEKSLGIERYEGMWEFTCLMVGAKAARIEELRVGKLDCSFFSEGVVRKAKTWWGWIRVLELEMLRCGENASVEGLREFLARLSELKKLGISFDPHAEAGITRLAEVIDGKSRWKNLEEMGVHGMSCRGMELLEILRRHKECKLERFRMGCVELESEDACIPVMWDIRSLKLERVEVRGWIRGKHRVWEGEFAKLERWLTDAEMEGECPLMWSGLGVDAGDDSSNSDSDE